MNPRGLGRRAAIGGLLAAAVAPLVVLPPRVAWGKPTDLPALPVAIGVVRGEGGDVVTKAFLDDQLAQTKTIFGEHELSFSFREPHVLDAKFARLETRPDRDAMAALLLPGVVNVFVVESLRDVDNPSLFRMGVCWRNLSNLAQKYVIVSAAARSTTTAHEIGHFFGNPHSFVKNNLMSYDRDGGRVFLDAAQALKVHRSARVALATKELLP